MPAEAPHRSVFVTGGAGFIGSRLIKSLKASGCGAVTVYDCLHPQVHGENAQFPDLGDNVNYVLGNVEDADLLITSLTKSNPDIVIHLASETGTGQSLDELDRYVAANVTGTTNLLSAIGRLPARDRDFLLSSSRSVYGEGPYKTIEGHAAIPLPRSSERMLNKDFNVYDSVGNTLIAVPSDEDTPPKPLSVYASTKLMQEHLLLNCAESKRLKAKILRFQNVYGPGQSLRNPYTGVLSIFAAQILAGKTLNIFEDGNMIRDFVFVDDVVSACVAALNHPHSIEKALNIGSGETATILEAANILLDYLGGNPNNYVISGDFRAGDIKYAATDINATKTRLVWSPQTSLQQGLKQLADWTVSEISGT